MSTYSFSESLIEDLSEEVLIKYYNNIENVTSVEKTEKIIRIDYDLSDPKNPKRVSTEEASFAEYNKFLTDKVEMAEQSAALKESSCGISNGYDCYETDWLQLETWIVKSGNGGEVSARFEWLTDPYYRNIDVFAIGLNSNFSPVPGTESGFYKYTMNYSGTHTVNYSTASKRDSGGYAYKIDLDDYGKKHRGYMQYDFIENRTGAKAGDAFSHYAHQEATFSVNPSISIPWGGGLSLSYADKFETVTGHAQLKPW